MTHDNTTNDAVPGDSTSDRSTGQSVEQAWDPEADETEWWTDDFDVEGRSDRRRPRRLITVVALLTVAGFAAATFVSSGESQSPATTVPPATTVIPASVAPSPDS